MNELRTFNEVEDNYLRAYNRLTTASNLNERGRTGDATKYLEQFSNNDRVAIAAVAGDIKTIGYDEVKRKIQVKLSDTFGDAA